LGNLHMLMLSTCTYTCSSAVPCWYCIADRPNRT